MLRGRRRGPAGWEAARAGHLVDCQAPRRLAPRGRRTSGFRLQRFWSLQPSKMLCGLQKNGGRMSASCRIRANCFQIRANYKLQGKASDRSGLWSACLAARACEGLSRTSNCGIRFGTAKRATRGCSLDGLVAPGSVEQRHTTAREEERERVKSFTSIYNKTYSLSHTSDGSRHIYLSSLALVDGAVTFGHCLHIFRHGREDVLAFPPF